MYGTHSVAAAVAAGKRPVYRIYAVSGNAGEKRRTSSLALTLDAAREKNIPVEYVSLPSLESMTDPGVHQGIAAHAAPYPFVPIEAILSFAYENGVSPFLLIADGVVDPHNLGALIRTSVCIGVDGLVIPRNNAVSPTPTVSRTSAGALEYMKIASRTNLSRTIESLKKQGIWVAGLDRSGNKPIYEYDLTGPIALVVGGEEKGIRRLVRQACDFVMAIAQTGDVESLNVSVAGGIAMYEIYRQRMQSG